MPRRLHGSRSLFHETFNTSLQPRKKKMKLHKVPANIINTSKKIRSYGKTNRQRETFFLESKQRFLFLSFLPHLPQRRVNEGKNRMVTRPGKETEESIKTCAVLLRVFSTFANNVPGIWYCDGCYPFTTPNHPFLTPHVFLPRVLKSPAAKNVHARRKCPRYLKLRYHPTHPPLIPNR